MLNEDIGRIMFKFIAIILLIVSCSSDSLWFARYDLLQKIGSINNFSHLHNTQYNHSSIIRENLYLSTNSFKKTVLCVYNGNISIDGNSNIVSFNNEIVRKGVSQGKFSSTTNFVLGSLELSSGTFKKINKSGYTILFTMSNTNSLCWVSSKINGKNQWISQDLSDFREVYYIVNRIHNQRSLMMLSVQKLKSNSNAYYIYDESVSSAKRRILTYFY